MVNICNECGKEFEGREGARFCSPACRMKASRAREVAKTPEPVATYADGTPMLPADAWREKKYPGFHTFGKQESHFCANCEKKFQTRLALLKFCSPECHPFGLVAESLSGAVANDAKD